MAPLANKIPGFYYDAEKNRYFPLPHPSGASQRRAPGTSASRPLTASLSIPLSSRSPQQLNGAGASQIKQNISDIIPNRVMRMSTLHPSFNSRQKYRHVHLAQQFAATSAYSNVENLPLESPISSFTVDQTNPRFQIVGTEGGSVCTRWTLTYDWPPDPLQADVGPSNSAPREVCWRNEFDLMSKITSTSISNRRFLATSFGPHPKALICGIADSPFYTGHILEHCPWDVWTGCFAGTGFVLGMSQHLWIVPDIEIHPSSRPRKTYTDIISLAQHDSLIYAGGRNGSVFQYDKRTTDVKCTELLKARTSVTNIQPLRSWELLITAINGDMNVYDLRALRKPQSLIYEPPCSVRLHGHNSSRSLTLPIAVDPSHDFVFAAGEDRLIRAWSTRTGEPLLPPASSSPVHSNVLSKQFEEDIVGIHISDTVSDPSPSLWVAHGETVERWDLGRQDTTK